MKHFEKTLKITALALAAVAMISLTNMDAEAATCGGDTTLTAESLTITPESECLEVTVDGECGDEPKVRVTFTNKCITTSNITGPDSFKEEIASDETKYDTVQIKSEVEENFSYTAIVGETSHEINIVVTGVYEDDGVVIQTCSTSNTGSAGLFVLLGFGLLLARRKTRR